MYRKDKRKKGTYVTRLLKTSERIFHTQDLGVLWGITNSNTLYTTIKRYTSKSILIPIYKGLYATLPVEQLDPLQLGAKALHSYTYVSCEWVLAKEGFINAAAQTITYIGSTSRRFTITKHDYRCRKLKDDFLFNPTGIYTRNGVFMASSERAIADMLYFNPRAYFDRPIPWKKIRDIQKTIGYPLTLKSKTAK